MSAFSAILEQFFPLEEHNSDVVTELRAGVVTFFTSSYIIFVQPAVLSSAGMALTFNIADGMALGFISYPLIKLFCGKAREVHWCIYLIAILFVFRYSVS